MAVVLFLIVSVLVVEANNKWGKYHWNLSTADTEANPLLIGDNLTSVWTSSLTTASADANLSVLKNQVVAGGSNANCDPTIGRVEVCNGQYGDNGWLGIASIWARGQHIRQGVVKVNDTYFASTTLPYGTQAWRDFVMCQEVNHEFGLDHQDEEFNNPNLGTCMDYTNDPDGTIANPDQLDNRKLNQHDRNTMVEIYTHLNGTSDGGNDGGKPSKCSPWPSCKKNQNQKSVGSNIDLNDPSAWGQAIRQDAQGRNSLFRRDLGNGQTLLTHVFWAE